MTKDREYGKPRKSVLTAVAAPIYIPCVAYFLYPPFNILIYYLFLKLKNHVSRFIYFLLCALYVCAWFIRDEKKISGLLELEL